MGGLFVRFPHVLPFEMVQAPLNFFVGANLPRKADESRRRLPILPTCSDRSVQDEHQSHHAAKLENPQPRHSSHLYFHRPALLQVSEAISFNLRTERLSSFSIEIGR